MKTKQYFIQTLFTLCAPSVDFILKFLGAEVVRGRSLKREIVYVTIESPAFCIFLYLADVHF